MPLARRCRCFLYCITSYGWLTKQSFHKTYLRLGLHYDFDWQRKPSGESLSKAVRHLQDERIQFQTKLKKFAHCRRIEKLHGQRFPTVKQIAELDTPDWILS